MKKLLSHMRVQHIFLKMQLAPGLKTLSATVQHERKATVVTNL